MGARAAAVLLAALGLPALPAASIPAVEPAGAHLSSDVLDAPAPDLSVGRSGGGSERPADTRSAREEASLLGSALRAPLPAPRVPVVEVPDDEPGVVVVATHAAAGVARALAPRLSEERRDLAAVLGADLLAPVEIRLGHGRDEFAGLLPGGGAPGWAPGLAYPGLGLVVVDVQASFRGGGAGQVLRHELAHIALDRAGGGRLPRWFSEGFAILHAGEWSVSRSVVLARAAGANALLPVDDLERGWPSSPTDVDLAYAQSVSLVTFLLRIEEGAAVKRLVAQLGDGHPFPVAFTAAFGQPVAGAEIDWRRSLRSRWGWLPIASDPNLAWGIAAVLLALGALRVHLRHRRRIDALPDEPESEQPDDPIPPLAQTTPVDSIASANRIETADPIVRDEDSSSPPTATPHTTGDDRR